MEKRGEEKRGEDHCPREKGIEKISSENES